MLIQQLISSDAEKVFIVGQNCSTATLVGNTLVCFESIGAIVSVVSFGNGFNNPTTSNLGAFAGVLNADVAAGAFGLIQAYGARNSIALVPTSTAVSTSGQGVVYGPAAGLVSGQTNGATFALGPIVMLDNAVSGPAGFWHGFIRAL